MSGSLPRLAVIGGGTMGRGIAQVAAQSGLDVLLIDQTQADLDRAMDGIEASWAKALEKQKLSQTQIESARSNLKLGVEMGLVSDRDFVVEAVFESAAVKSDLFSKLGTLTPATAILASNTSSISIDVLAEASGRPERTIGMHFFNPVPLMPLVEVVRGSATSLDSIEQTMALAERMGKTPVQVTDSPGFVVNRLLIPMLNEAIQIYSEGVASAEGIDTVMKLGASHPMGPLALADLIGLDVVLSIMEVLHHDFGNDKYAPAELLREMVAEGKLGRKTGRGFYQYGAGGAA